MKHLKSLVLAVATATLASQAVAGGFAPVVAAPEPVAPVTVVEPTAPRSTFGILLPLALLGGLVALAVAADEDDDSTEND
ncbi:hypothetical protein [Rubellimicrobium arenae]|uniref:hypothetical protein n=1 Tax=Rubellimicrobium arenae TaxID=2817372 RepID=UPI001B3040A7|nr:hypothetical protein [Rubellimicrobium arenae]